MRRALFSATILTTLACAGAVAAQDLGVLQQPPSYSRGRNTAVLERAKPGWDPISMRLGAFELYPELAVQGGYTSNVKKATTNEDGDTFLRVRPAARLLSTWSRHGLGLSGWAARQIYTDASEDNATEYNVSGTGRIDILRDFYLDGRVSHSRLVLPRLDPEVPVDTIDPLYNKQDIASLRLVRTVSRLQVALAVTAQSDNFGVADRRGGGSYDFNPRDRDLINYGGRVTYALSPDFAVFGAVVQEQSERPGFAGGSFDSEATSVVGGANFDLSNLARGEVAVGYLKQNYETGGVDSDGGVAVNAEVQWFPTQLTTVGLTAARRSSPQIDARSPGAIDHGFALTVDHELLRNVILSGRTSYTQTDYALIDRKDKQTKAGASVGYRMNRHLRFDLGYDYTDQQSRGFNARRSFEDHTVSLTLFAYK